MFAAGIGAISRPGLDLRLQEVQTRQLTHEGFLETPLQDELNDRRERLLNRRNKAAAFREQRTLDGFGFAFNASIDRKQIYQLATGDFTAKAEDILLIGPPGVGKSHLAQAIGHELVKQGKLVLFRSIFDILDDLHRSRHEHAQLRMMKRYLKCDLLI